MWNRIKFWLMGNKDCEGCCLGCSFYEGCSEDVLYEKAAKRSL